MNVLNIKHSLRLSFCIVLLVFFNAAQANSLERLFAPKPELWGLWAVHESGSSEKLDHQAWTVFLQRYITQHKDGINRINYQVVTNQDKQYLKQYIATLSQVEISEYSRSQQLSYWINLYNALTIDVILNHYPVKSIRDVDISPGIFKDGPWDKKLLRIQGEMVSLNDIEHRILRPVWKDARLHYALNCASLGCPNIQLEAYTEENTDRLLLQAAKEFINHPRAVSVAGEKLIISSIYNWFRKDFANNEKALIDHIRQYASPSLQQQLENFDSVSSYQYDWSLNDTSNAN